MKDCQRIANPLERAKSKGKWGNEKMGSGEKLIIEAERVWKEGDSGKALELLSHPSLKEHPQANFLSGEIHYNNQKWGLALNSFRRCLQLDPGNLAAQTYVDLILNILGFFHTDQFNP